MGYRILFVLGRFITVRDRQQNSPGGVRTPDFFRKWMFSCFLCTLNAQHGWLKTLKTELLKLFKFIFLNRKIQASSFEEKSYCFPALGKRAWRAGGGGWSVPQQSCLCGSAAWQVNPAQQSSLSWCCCLSKCIKAFLSPRNVFSWACK